MRERGKSWKWNLKKKWQHSQNRHITLPQTNTPTKKRYKPRTQKVTSNQNTGSELESDDSPQGLPLERNFLDRKIKPLKIGFVFTFTSPIGGA